MAQRLKRWESPRREGRNDKGKGGTARQRQRRKQFQALRQRLKDQSDSQSNNQQSKKRDGINTAPFFLAIVSGVDRHYHHQAASIEFPKRPRVSA